MSDQLVEIFESFDTVGEMTSDPGGLVPLRSDLVEQVTKGDDNPKFATFTIESGWSKSKRFWGPELFHDVVSEINNGANGGEAVVGYMGHIPKDQDPYSFPPIQMQFVGAKIVHNSGDKAKMAVKAYLLPGSTARDYFERGLVKSVSWRGKVAQEVFQQGVKVKKFLLESIDLSRPRAAGMNARLVGALTSEMEDNERSDKVKPEEILALQENELRAHNPGLVQSIEASARQPLETQVSEMTEEAKKSKPALDLIPEFRKLLGLTDESDDLVTVQAVVAYLRAHGRQLRDAVLDKVLLKKLTGGEEKDRALVRSLIATEMRDRNFVPTGEDEKDEQAVSEMVNSIIDSNELLKTTVSEMMEAPPNVTNTERDRSKPARELKVGTVTKSIRVRSASR